MPKTEIGIEYVSEVVMTQSWRTHPQFGHVALCDGPEGLTAIREPHINLVIWAGAIPKPLVDLVGAAPYHELYSLPRNGPQPPWNRWFRTVLWCLKDEVAARIDSPPDRIQMDVRVQRHNGDEEPMDVQYFHRDGGENGSGISYRAIAHLTGPPTLWLPETAPRKKFTIHRTPSSLTSVRYLSTMHWTQRMPAASLCLFRGQRMGVGSRALMHRAPRCWTGTRLTVAFDYWG